MKNRTKFNTVKKRKLPISKRQLYIGCILKTISAAVTLPRFMVLEHCNDWSDNNIYNVNDISGGLATVVFRDDECVCAVSNVRSDRFGMNINLLFELAPDFVKDITKEEIYDFFLYKGKDNAIATAGFWSEGNDIYSADDIKAFFSNGGDILIHELSVDSDCIFEDLKNEYEMTNDEYNMMIQLYEEKRNNLQGSIGFSIKAGYDFLKTDVKALKSVKRLLYKIGIILED